MSGALSQEAVIVIVIAGAGAAVLLAYAAHAAFTRGRVSPYANVFTRNDDQDRYMREMRDKRFAGIRMEERWPKKPMRVHSGDLEREQGVRSPDY
jgi:hypothetical protein